MSLWRSGTRSLWFGHEMFLETLVLKASSSACDTIMRVMWYSLGGRAWLLEVSYWRQALSRLYPALILVSASWLTTMWEAVAIASLLWQNGPLVQSSLPHHGGLNYLEIQESKVTLLPWDRFHQLFCRSDKKGTQHIHQHLLPSLLLGGSKLRHAFKSWRSGGWKMTLLLPKFCPIN